MSQSELSDHENIALEAAQEDQQHRVSADNVVAYARTQEVEITKQQASRALRSLAKMGLLTRSPRASHGWGRGWQQVTYDLAQSGRVQPKEANVYILQEMGEARAKMILQDLLTELGDVDVKDLSQIELNLLHRCAQNPPDRKVSGLDERILDRD